MPTPVTGSAIWLFTIWGRLNNQRIMYTSLLQRDGLITSTDYQATGATFLNTQDTDPTEFVSELLLTHVNVFAVDFLTMQPIYPNRYTAVTLETPGKLGNLSGTPLPQNVAATITKTSVDATRWGRGAIHLSGQPAAEAQNGNWTPTHKVRLQNVAGFYADGLDQGGGAAGWNFVLWSPKVPTRVTMVTDAIVQDTCRVQRRRTVRVGI